MKLESITVENYRQFEKAELTFDEGITILAGANNSGKTSLINLIKNIFVDDKLNYNMSDIPAKNMREWVEWVYPIFQKFFRDRKTEENVEKDLLNVVIPKEETDSTHLMKMTTVKIHVSYNPDMDDIKLFADCIMDLDETKHDFYFMYNFEIVHTQFAREIINNFSKIKHRFAEIEEKKSQYAETTDELIINNIQVKERYLKQLIVSLYIQATIPNVYFCDEDYKNKCKFDETKKFRQLFNFCFIKASSNLIPAHLFKDGLRHIHPDPEQARTITVREAARLQTFPDNYYFNCSQTDAFKMIGNAVPPLFAKKVAYAIYHLIQEN